jgi:hypothetical protein
VFMKCGICDLALGRLDGYCMIEGNGFVAGISFCIDRHGIHHGFHICSLFGDQIDVLRGFTAMQILAKYLIGRYITLAITSSVPGCWTSGAE